MENVIIARHAGLVEWFRRNGITGKVVSHATPSDIEGKHVYGMLPFNLAAQAASVTVVDMPRLTLEQRGKELTPEEMDIAGASLTTYVVKKVENVR